MSQMSEGLTHQRFSDRAQYEALIHDIRYSTYLLLSLPGGRRHLCYTSSIRCHPTQTAMRKALIKPTLPTRCCSFPNVMVDNELS